MTPTRIRFPLSGYIGFAIMLVAWFFAWLPSHPLSAGSFILLWVGFIFLLDGVAYLRRGTSIAHQYPAKFAQLFLFSVPLWWLFEAFNARIQNWHYLLDHPYGMTWEPVSYNIMATLCFSTVLPAVMEITAIVTSFAPFAPRYSKHETVATAASVIVISEFAAGLFCIAATLIWPHYAFGLVWLGPLFIIDAVNTALGNRSLISRLVASDWHFIASIALAALICGFFWEMWNYWSLPKWYYTVPFVGFAKIFEMPALGFLGYLPFGCELFALYQFLLWLTRQQEDALPF
jgi:hypothetical protein